jgi:hypothetical protein
MTNYYTEYITANNIKTNDFINIHNNMCKVLNIKCEHIVNTEYLYLIKCINEHEKVVDIKIPYNTNLKNNKEILKYNFLYTFDIWIPSVNNNYIKLIGDFISYDYAEEYIKQHNYNNYYIIKNIDNIYDITNELI